MEESGSFLAAHSIAAYAIVGFWRAIVLQEFVSFRRNGGLSVRSMFAFLRNMLPFTKRMRMFELESVFRGSAVRRLGDRAFA
jgi:hypothetical protein